MGLTAQSAETAAMVGVLMALIGVLKLLVQKIPMIGQAKKSQIQVKPSLTTEEHEWLKNLHELHNERDEDGVPRWYIPRSLTNIQKELLDKLQTMAVHQEKTTYILDRILIRLDKGD